MKPLSAWLTAAITIIGSGLGTSFVGLLLSENSITILKFKGHFSLVHRAYMIATLTS